MTDREACVALNMLPGVGPVTVKNILNFVDSPAAILECKSDAVFKHASVKAPAADAIRNWQRHVCLDAEFTRIRHSGVQLLAMTEDSYPESLKEIYDPPLCLYVRGSVASLSTPRMLAVVGSRRTTHYGAETTDRLVRSCVAAGWTVVSGLARGIDTAAHRAAVEGNGVTIAVIAGGLGHIYPPENIPLARLICETGAVISEQPMDVKPDRRSFPMRNRIIAGLTTGTLVVEAGTRSGSLITAQQALDQGRHVFAVPGRVDSPQSRGCHALLKQGARLVERFEDIDEEFAMLPMRDTGRTRAADVHSGEHALPTLTDDERVIMEVLEKGEMNVDEISRHAELPIPKVLTNLLGLEMKRAVRQGPGKVYSIRKS